MTKEHIEKVIRHNRPGYAAHQIWRELQAETAATPQGSAPPSVRSIEWVAELEAAHGNLKRLSEGQESILTDAEWNYLANAERLITRVLDSRRSRSATEKLSDLLE